MQVIHHACGVGNHAGQIADGICQPSRPCPIKNQGHIRLSAACRPNLLQPFRHVLGIACHTEDMAKGDMLTSTDFLAQHVVALMDRRCDGGDIGREQVEQFIERQRWFD